MKTRTIQRRRYHAEKPLWPMRFLVVALWASVGYMAVTTIVEVTAAMCVETPAWCEKIAHKRPIS